MLGARNHSDYGIWYLKRYLYRRGQAVSRSSFHYSSCALPNPQTLNLKIGATRRGSGFRGSGFRGLALEWLDGSHCPTLENTSQYLTCTPPNPATRYAYTPNPRSLLQQVVEHGLHVALENFRRKQRRLSEIPGLKSLKMSTMLGAIQGPKDNKVELVG